VWRPLAPVLFRISLLSPVTERKKLPGSRSSQVSGVRRHFKLKIRISYEAIILHGCMRMKFVNTSWIKVADRGVPVNMMRATIFWPKRKKVTGSERKPHNGWRRNVQPSPYIAGPYMDQTKENEAGVARRAHESVDKCIQNFSRNTW
jgi:hypothetical protein